ncbi:MULTISPECIES: transglutaminase [Halobacterium]|uniref:transglutaminase n=1 Tax=Halobacterium TaxID=2239 RepID=UPI000A52E550|nr:MULTISPECIES: transglutaminase [Halobacterium]MCG1004921.1 hypothetical protein [Halobacterium noricense]
MSRTLSVGTTKKQSILLVGILSVAFLGGTGTVAATQSEMYVTISDVAVSNETPTTADSITVTPTIHYSSERAGGFQITEIELIAPGHGEISKVDDVGAIASGESLEVPLAATFDTAGKKRLLVRVRGIKEDDNGTIEQIGSIERPVYITVSEPASPEPVVSPRIQINTNNMVAEADNLVSVTVSNGDSDSISDLVLNLTSEQENIEPKTKIRPSLAAKNMTTMTFNIQPEDSVQTTLHATLKYNNGQSVEVNKKLQVNPLHEDVNPSVSIVENNGSQTLQYHVTNLGNTPIQDVSVMAAINENVLPTRAIDMVPPSTTRTITVPVSAVPEGEYQVKVTYRLHSETKQVTQTTSLTASAENDRNNGAVQSLTMSPIKSSGGSIGIVALALIAGGGSVVGYQRYRSQ